MAQLPPHKRALLSVSDKTHLIEFAQALINLKFELLSTGGTANFLRQQNIPVTEISDYTKFPEIMDGRVKTLHPKIHGGILGRPGQDEAVFQQHGITPISIVVVNLYPFAQTIANPHCRLEDAIEKIDIGGPTLLRAAAKNYQHVSIITDPKDYRPLLAEIREYGDTQLNTRFSLAQKAFSHIADYDASIANYLGSRTLADEHSKFPATYTVQWQKKQALRYGENPHQEAAFYIETGCQEPSIATAKQWQGKELSYNNIADADAALACVKSFAEPACVIVKHANPCGVALGKNLLNAYQNAFATDPTSAFGGIIAINETVDAPLATAILQNQFMEVLIAPEVTPAALAVFQQKPAIRILSCGQFTQSIQQPCWDYKKITGGVLVQDYDDHVITQQDLKTVTKRTPTAQELEDLLFAWKVVKFVKSNAIVFAKNQMTVGIGAGQMSRIDSVNIAVQKANKAGLSTQGSVLASDAFFPFKDGIEQAILAGVTAIIQPGGSIRDQEVITAADNAGIAMVFTHVRHFRH